MICESATLCGCKHYDISSEGTQEISLDANGFASNCRSSYNHFWEVEKPTVTPTVGDQCQNRLGLNV
jgi:hypothetical protein